MHCSVLLSHILVLFCPFRPYCFTVLYYCTLSNTLHSRVLSLFCPLRLLVCCAPEFYITHCWLVFMLCLYTLVVCGLLCLWCAQVRLTSDSFPCSGPTNLSAAPHIPRTPPRPPPRTPPRPPPRSPPSPRPTTSPPLVVSFKMSRSLTDAVKAGNIAEVIVH